MTQFRMNYKASTILASQNVMRVLILNSNGNVAIQTKNRASSFDPVGVTEEGRLYCSHCHAAKEFSLDVMINETRLLEELEWATHHKHAEGQTFTVEQGNSPTTTSGERKLKVIQ